MTAIYCEFLLFYSYVLMSKFTPFVKTEFIALHLKKKLTRGRKHLSSNLQEKRSPLKTERTSPNTIDIKMISLVNILKRPLSSYNFSKKNVRTIYAFSFIFFLKFKNSY